MTNQLEEKNICSHKLKRDVEEEKLEVENLRNQLDKMAENFRRSFSQRKQLIERWETSVEELRCADREIDRLATVRRFSFGKKPLSQRTFCFLFDL